MNPFLGTLTIEDHPAELSVSGMIGLEKGPAASHYKGIVDFPGPIDALVLFVLSPDAVLDVEGGVKINVLRPARREGNPPLGRPSPQHSRGLGVQES